MKDIVAKIKAVDVSIEEEQEDTTEDCDISECGPALGMPNYLCPDGKTTAGPGRCLRQSDGKCGWEVISCPTTSSDEEETTETQTEVQTETASTETTETTSETSTETDTDASTETNVSVDATSNVEATAST